jgi:hypothetical protein
MINYPRTIARILLAAGLTALAGCDIGQPLAVIPEPDRN